MSLQQLFDSNLNMPQLLFIVNLPLEQISKYLGGYLFIERWLLLHAAVFNYKLGQFSILILGQNLIVKGVKITANLLNSYPVLSLELVQRKGSS